jgi:O-antigen ligase
MLLAIALIIFAWIAYYKPLFAVGLILALLPTYLIRFSVGGGSAFGGEIPTFPTTFLELLLAIFLLITFVAERQEFKTLKSLGAVNWLGILFVLAGIVSIIISPDKHAAIGIFKAFILEPVLFFYALKLTLKKPLDLTTPLNLLFLGAIVISLFGIFQYFTLINLPLQFWGTGEEVKRITSVFTYPNALALYLSPLISFFLTALIWDEKILNKKNLSLGLLIMSIALVLTFSRGSWLAVITTAFILLFVKYPFKKVLPVVLVSAAVLLALPAFRERLWLITHDSSSSAHIQLMTAGINKLKQSPILGNGLGGFRETLRQQNFSGEILNYPHNIFLNFWLEMSLVGLVGFFGVIFVSIKKYRVNQNWYTGAAAAFLATMILHGMVDVPYFKNDLAILFWFMISIFYI